MTPIEAISSGADLSVSLSGGKDSTATYLHLLESGTLDAVERAGGKVYRVFADTGWELPATYAYLDELQKRFGKIHRVATWVPGPNEAPPVGYDQLEPIWKTERGGGDGVSRDVAGVGGGVPGAGVRGQRRGAQARALLLQAVRSGVPGSARLPGLRRAGGAC